MKQEFKLNDATYRRKAIIRISDDEKWQAVIRCDKSYNNQFFYGVKTTGIFCRLSCRTKAPLRDNTVFFDTAEDAIIEGFRPCKKCRPDMPAFEPDIELAENAKQAFDANYNKTVSLNHISKQLGTSTNHLIKLFRQYTGFTPVQYINGLKIAKAGDLLGQTNVSILEISYAAGFKSVSNFYKCFKEQTGKTPGEYRRDRRRP